MNLQMAPPERLRRALSAVCGGEHTPCARIALVAGLEHGGAIEIRVHRRAGRDRAARAFGCRDAERAGLSRAGRRRRARLFAGGAGVDGGVAAQSASRRKTQARGGRNDCRVMFRFDNYSEPLSARRKIDAAFAARPSVGAAKTELAAAEAFLAGRTGWKAGRLFIELRRGILIREGAYLGGNFSSGNAALRRGIAESPMRHFRACGDGCDAGEKNRRKRDRSGATKRALRARDGPGKSRRQRNDADRRFFRLIHTFLWFLSLTGGCVRMLTFALGSYISQIDLGLDNVEPGGT